MISFDVMNDAENNAENDEYKNIIILLCSMLTVYVQKHCAFLILYTCLNIVTMSS